MLYYILSKITAKRLEKNYSQQYMATKLGISQGYYNKLENGKNEMSAQTMFNIFEILDMDTDELFCSDKTTNQHN